MIRRLCLCAIVGTKAAATAFAASGAGDEKDKLAALRELKIENGKITLVEYDDASTLAGPNGNAFNYLPPRTIVKIVLHPAKGSNIQIEIWLPTAEKWNGRFLGAGNGGAAGNINPASLAWPLYGGYAVATTDMGTAPNADSGIGNPEVWKDFGFRATHLMTVVAKQVIAAYYGKAPAFSYFNGGSTGGQQALQEAQRYPEDYDGIVANIPAHCRTPLHAYFLWNDQILNRCPFTESQQKSIISAGNEYKAAREIPQTAGMLVSDPRCDLNDIEAVIRLARDKDPTLTDDQAAALRKLFDGPKHDVTGERIFCGIPFGSSFDIARGHLYLFKWVFGADKDLMSIDFGKDIDAYTAALGPYLNAENADLGKFAARGGKLIMISGSADSCVPYTASLDYYERVAEQCGSLAKAQSFILFYIVPGMSHGPGPGINKLPSMLDLVVNWREKGFVLGKIQAQRVVDGKTELDMPLYPYPMQTGYSVETGFIPLEGPRRGVDRIAERFRPPAASSSSPSQTLAPTSKAAPLHAGQESLAAPAPEATKIPGVRSSEVLLWEAGPPGGIPGAHKGLRTVSSDGVPLLTNVGIPSIVVHTPQTSCVNRSAVILCPGGAYQVLASVDSGNGTLEPFLKDGFVVIVLKYRTVPNRQQAEEDALVDARRAVRLVRHRAAEWGIDPGQIGVAGWSAGGNLVLNLASHVDKGNPADPDPVERKSCRPDFVAMLCPWPTRRPAGAYPLSAESPPAFIASAQDDKDAPTRFAVGIAETYLGVGVPRHLWIIEQGGHRAFSYDSTGEGSHWRDHFVDWLRRGMPVGDVRPEN